jgi:hypothetical protein
MGKGTRGGWRKISRCSVVCSALWRKALRRSGGSGDARSKKGLFSLDEIVYILKCGARRCDAAAPSLKRLLPLKAEEHLQRDRDFHDPLEEAHKRPPFVDFKR